MMKIKQTILTVLGVLGILMMGGGVFDASAATLVYWQFESGNFTADSSGNGHTLANSGATSALDSADNAPGAGSAVFNGSSIMNTVDTLDLTPYSQLTIEWFMKPTMTSSTQAAIVWEDSNFFNSGALAGFINLEPNSVSVDHDEGSEYGGVTGPVPDGTVSGTWHHYAMEVDSTDVTSAGIKLYIDGVATGSFSVSGSVTAAAFLNDTFFIGARGGLIAPYIGSIDEFRISDGFLAPSQFLNAVPEPSSVVLLTLGCGFILLVLRRKWSGSIPIYSSTWRC